MLSRETKFILAISFQLCVILGIVIFKTLILLRGTEVLLKIEPIDPRDPLRGDYLTFQYQISTIPEYYFEYSPIRDGDTVYVPLKRVGKYYIATPGIRKEKPTDAEIFIKGKVAARRLRYGPDRIYVVYKVVYGIEEYFIPEGVGREFDWRKEASALVVIDENGNAVLKQIFIEDKPWP